MSKEEIPTDESRYCGYCGELRDDLNASLPFCDRCLADRVPQDTLWRIATTALSILEFRTWKVEDLFPPTLIARVIDRYLAKPSGVDEDFVSTLKAGQPMVQQVEDYANKNGIPLEEGWKVEVASVDTQNRQLMDTSKPAIN